jgi:hypothetical protein
MGWDKPTSIKKRLISALFLASTLSQVYQFGVPPSILMEIL